MHDQNQIHNPNDGKLSLALLLIRISVFFVIFMWTLDKFLNPGHAVAVYESFYFIGGVSNTVMYVIGAVEMLLLLGFLLGMKKTLTYGFVLIIHAVSTITPIKNYLAPFDGNLLFFAAIPMLAACWALFSLREHDTRFSFG